jgi:hypothetical protein
MTGVVGWGDGSSVMLTVMRASWRMVCGTVDPAQG